MTRQFHREKSISTIEYLSKIVNIYRFIPKEKSENLSSSEEDEGETTETITNTNTNSTLTYNIDEVDSDSDNDADQLAIVEPTTSAIETTPSTIPSNNNRKEKVQCQFCCIDFTSFGLKRHQNKCKARIALSN